MKNFLLLLTKPILHAGRHVQLLISLFILCNILIYGQVRIKETVEINNKISSQINQRTNSVEKEFYNLAAKINFPSYSYIFGYPPNEQTGYLECTAQIFYDSNSPPWLLKEETSRGPITMVLSIRPRRFYRFKWHFGTTLGHQPPAGTHPISAFLIVEGDTVKSYFNNAYASNSLTLYYEPPAPLPTCDDAPQCDGEPVAPTVSVSPNYSNGASGVDACQMAKEADKDAAGIFYPLLEDFEKAFENFEVELCYNSSKNKWQPSIKSNNIKVRAIADICTDEISDGELLNSINDIETINPDELCDALYSFRGHKYLPLKFYQGYKKFYIGEVLFQHEFEHANDFQNITIPAAINDKVIVDGKKFPSFGDAFSSFDKNCEDDPNYDEVKSEAEAHTKKILEGLKRKLRERFSEDSKSLDANDREYHRSLHGRNEIQKWVKLYIKTIEKRIKKLGIKC